MKKVLQPLFLAALVLAGCGDLIGGGRIGTDAGGSSAETSLDGPFQATWSRLVGDSSETSRIDTIAREELNLIPLPLPESTCLAVVRLEGPGGAWVGARDSILRLIPPAPLVVRWKDDLERDGWVFELPCTGVRVGMPGSRTWMRRTVPVFADIWPGRIVRREGERVGAWSLGPIRLADTLELDVSSLGDSSCEARSDSAGILTCGVR